MCGHSSTISTLYTTVVQALLTIVVHWQSRARLCRGRAVLRNPDYHPCPRPTYNSLFPNNNAISWRDIGFAPRPLCLSLIASSPGWFMCRAPPCATLTGPTLRDAGYVITVLRTMPSRSVTPSRLEQCTAFSKQTIKLITRYRIRTGIELHILASQFKWIGEASHGLPKYSFSKYANILFILSK